MEIDGIDSDCVLWFGIAELISYEFKVSLLFTCQMHVKDLKSGKFLKFYIINNAKLLMIIYLKILLNNSVEYYLITLLHDSLLRSQWKR